MRGPFSRHRDRIEVRLGQAELFLLRQVPALLASVGAHPDDPASSRLTRLPVYLDDPEADAEFWDWTSSELARALEADRSAFELLVEEEGKARLSLPEAEACLRVLGRARLALAARLGVDVEEDYQRLDEHERALLDYLAWLQGSLVEVLVDMTLG